MNRTTALRLLKQEKAHLAREFEVADLALFGSVARDEAREGSDVDILVKFDGPATSKRYFCIPLDYFNATLIRSVFHPIKMRPSEPKDIQTP